MEGLGLATSENYDVLIVDRMLPKLDGLAVIQALRTSKKNTPCPCAEFARQGGGTRAGLARGRATITSPSRFPFDELLARVEALSRRNIHEAETVKLAVGDLEMNLISREVTRSGKSIGLQNREFPPARIPHAPARARW